MSGEFLPVTMEECRERGIEQPDFVYVCGSFFFRGGDHLPSPGKQGVFGGNDSSAGLERSGKHPGVW